MDDQPFQQNSNRETQFSQPGPTTAYFNPKFIIGIVLVLILGGAAYGGCRWWGDKTRQLPLGTSEPEICVQVITPARNPKTGEVADFPTPCDVPEGWDVIR